MGRYDLPGPKCRHVIRKGKPATLVSSQPPDRPFDPDVAHASAWVCQREECVKDAEAWVWASTHRKVYTTKRD